MRREKNKRWFRGFEAICSRVDQRKPVERLGWRTKKVGCWMRCGELGQHPGSDVSTSGGWWRWASGLGDKAGRAKSTDMEIICTELLAKDVTVNEYAWEERKAEKRAEDRPLRKTFMLKKRKRRQWKRQGKTLRESWGERLKCDVTKGLEGRFRRPWSMSGTIGLRRSLWTRWHGH